jgi:hypothetical protein
VNGERSERIDHVKQEQLGDAEDAAAQLDEGDHRQQRQRVGRDHRAGGAAERKVRAPAKDDEKREAGDDDGAEDVDRVVDESWARA